LTQAASPEIYLSLWQATAFSKHLVIRTAADPRTVMVAVERELRAVDPTAAIENPRTLAQIRDDSLASRTFAMQLLVGFAVVGSMLTLVGIYGVLALSVASRRRELGIRLAVGAQQKDIRKLIFGEGFRLIASGVFAGVVLAIVLSRVLRTFLFEVQPNDPMTLIVVGRIIRGSGAARMLGASATSCKGRPARGVTLRMSCVAEERPSRERSVLFIWGREIRRREIRRQHTYCRKRSLFDE
jgi:putative ABC transport system permease protein